MTFSAWLTTAGCSWARYSKAAECKAAWLSGVDPHAYRAAELTRVVRQNGKNLQADSK